MVQSVFGKPKTVKHRPALRVTEDLRSVVQRVRDVLVSGRKVYFVGRRYHKEVNRLAVLCKYSEEVSGIRLSRSALLIQVQLPTGWSTVWSTEALMTDNGEVLYQSPDFEEVEKMVSGEYLNTMLHVQNG